MRTKRRERAIEADWYVGGFYPRKGNHVAIAEVVASDPECDEGGRIYAECDTLDDNGVVEVLTLIAAAPDMLDMLQHVADFMRNRGAHFSGDDQERWLLEDVEKLIRKATE